MLKRLVVRKCKRGASHYWRDCLTTNLPTLVIDYENKDVYDCGIKIDDIEFSDLVDRVKELENIYIKRLLREDKLNQLGIKNNK